MRKPSLSDMLAPKEVAAPVVTEVAPPPAMKKDDGRINTTIRISPEGLEALKIVAAGERIRVNDLLLEGAEHVLALRGKTVQLRR